MFIRNDMDTIFAAALAISIANSGSMKFYLATKTTNNISLDGHAVTLVWHQWFYNPQYYSRTIPLVPGYSQTIGKVLTTSGSTMPQYDNISVTLSSDKKTITWTNINSPSDDLAMIFIGID